MTSQIEQERLRALGQMASGMAHDINNSLTPIIGYSDFLLDPRSGVPEDSRKYLHYIRTAAADIAQMVNQVRQFYRRRGETEPVSPVDLNKVAKSALESTGTRRRDIAQKEGIALTVETSLEKSLPAVLGNESELREAVVNLLANAIEAMPEGGVLRLTSGIQNRPPTESVPSRSIYLEISDSGVGMDQTTQERCFEPFFSTKGPVGTGLGLAIVFGIVRRHGGTIEITSSPGKGTTMRLIFQALAPTENLAAVRGGAADSGRLRILCIDDDQRISTMLREVLSSDHHQVEVANGGKKGLEVFRKAQERHESFDVVITDLGMPNVDGRQIVRAVKTESPGTPVILLTSWATMMDQEGELPPGVDAVLSKPASMDRLQEVLSQVTLAKAGVV